MNKYKKIVSIAATAVMCVAPMSVYAQEAQTDVIEAVAEKKQDTESSSVPVLQKEGIEISEEPGAATVKALEQGTIVISYKTTSENAIQSLLSVGNGTKGNQDRHFHLYITNAGGVGMELRNTDGEFKYTLDCPAAVRGSYKGERVSNTVALKADKENKQYKLFANGELIATLDQEAFKSGNRCLSIWRFHRENAGISGCTF